jgi:hypothetical protein
MGVKASGIHHQARRKHAASKNLAGIAGRPPPPARSLCPGAYLCQPQHPSGLVQFAAQLSCCRGAGKAKLLQAVSILVPSGAWEGGCVRESSLDICRKTGLARAAGTCAMVTGPGRRVVHDSLLSVRCTTCVCASLRACGIDHPSPGGVHGSLQLGVVAPDELLLPPQRAVALPPLAPTAGNLGAPVVDVFLGREVAREAVPLASYKQIWVERRQGVLVSGSDSPLGERVARGL